MGNGSGSDANTFSLIKLSIDPFGSDGFESGQVQKPNRNKALVINRNIGTFWEEKIPI